MFAFLLSWKLWGSLLAGAAILGGVWFWHSSAVAQARESGRKAGFTDGQDAANKAHEQQAAENRKKSAALLAQLVAASAENAKLKKEIRNALDRPDDIVYGPRVLCLRARSRGYPCEGEPAGSVPDPLPGTPAQPLRGRTDEAGAPDGR